MNSIGDRIRRLREKLRLSQSALAQAARLQAATISKYERGAAIPGGEAVIGLSRALGCDPNYLLLGDGRMSESIALIPGLADVTSMNVEADQLVVRVEIRIDAEEVYQALRDWRGYDGEELPF